MNERGARRGVRWILSCLAGSAVALAGAASAQSDGSGVRAGDAAAVSTLTVFRQLSYLSPALPIGSTFTIDLSCTSQGTAVTDITPSAHQTVAPTGTVQFGNIPVGAICDVSQSSPPPAPPGYLWPALDSRPSQYVSAAGISVTLTDGPVAESLIDITLLVTGGTVTAGTTFPVTLSCSRQNRRIDVLPSSSQSFAAGATIRFSNIPSDSICNLSEGALPSPPAGLAWVRTTIPSLVFPKAGLDSLSIVNELAPLTSVTLQKTVAGGTLPPGSTFNVGLACTTPLGNVTTIAPTGVQSIAPGDSLVFSNIPVGATCTVQNLGLPQAPSGYSWVAASASANTFIVTANGTFNSTSTLALSRSLVINVVVTGGTVAPGTTFPLSVDCRAGTEFLTLTPSSPQSAEAGGSVTFGGVRTGATCTINSYSRPSPPPGSVWANTIIVPTEVTIGNADGVATVTFPLVPTTTLEVLESVSGGTPSPGTTFTVSVDCSSSVIPFLPTPTPARSQTMAAGSRAVFGNIPVGSSCSVSGSGTTVPAPAGYAWGYRTVAPLPIVIAASGNAVTVTDVLVPAGTLKLSEVVTGGPAPDGSFSMLLDCTLRNAPVTGIVPSSFQSILAGTSVTFSAIPVGSTCSVTQTAIPNPPGGYLWRSAVKTPTVATVTADGSAAITVTNSLVEVATVSVTKAMVGGSVPDATTFQVSINCQFNGGTVFGITPFNSQQQIKIGGTVSFGNIPVGSSCSLTEYFASAAPAGYEWGKPAVSPSTAFTIASGVNAVTLTNSIVPLRTLTVTSMVTGGQVAADARLPVGVNCSFDGSTYLTSPSSQTVAPGGTVSFNGIPQGASCTVYTGTQSSMPTPPRGFVWGASTFDPSATVTIGPATNVTVTYPLVAGSIITVNKVVTGGTPRAGTGFTVSLSCYSSSFNIGPLAPGNPQVIAPGGSVQYWNIPAGAQCGITEYSAQPAPPDGYAWGATTYTPTGLTTVAGENNVLTSTTVLVPTTSVDVTVNVGGGTAGAGSVFGISIGCRLPGVSGGSTSTTRNVLAGETATFAGIPVGSSCSVSEDSLPLPPAGFGWSTRSVSPSSFTVVAGSNAVSVVNTLVPTTSLSVTAAVTGGTMAPEARFRLNVYCTTAVGAVNNITPASSQLAEAGGSVTFSGIPIGASCRVSSDSLQLPSPPAGKAWSSIAISPPDIILAATNNSVVAVFELVPMTTVEVKKIVSGGPLPAESKFSLSITCDTRGGFRVSGIVATNGQLAGAGESVTFANVPVDSNCRISEDSVPPAPAGYVWSDRIFNPGSFTVAATGNVVSVTDRLSIAATLSITKFIDGTGADPNRHYQFSVNCSGGEGTLFPQIVPSYSQSIAAGETVAFSGIPLGWQCGVSEYAGDAPTGYTWLPPTWTFGSSSTQELSTRVTITSAASAMAVTNHIVPRFRLSYVRGGNGTGTVTINPSNYKCTSSCTLDYSQGTIVTLSAVASGDSTFAGWSGAGCSGTGTCVVALDAAKSVTAIFRRPFSIDVDANGAYDALTDGVIILRHLFGITGPALTAGVLGSGAARTDPAEIATYLGANAALLDVDGNGSADALTDGLMLMRWLFGIRGLPLTQGVLGAGATVTTPDSIAGAIGALAP